MAKNSDILSKLIDLIDSEKCTVGTRLPSERNLCKILGTSRNTLRRVLAVLETRGNIAVKGGSGTYLISTSGLTKEGETQVSEDDDGTVESDKLEARYLLEPFIMGYAAKYVDDEVIEDLQNRIVYLSRAILASDIQSVLMIETSYLQRIMGCWGNGIARSVIGLLQPSLSLARKVFNAMSEKEKDHYFALGVEVLNALKQHDRTLLESVIKSRIVNFCHLSEKYSFLKLSPILSKAITEK